MAGKFIRTPKIKIMSILMVMVLLASQYGSVLAFTPRSQKAQDPLPPEVTTETVVVVIPDESPTTMTVAVVSADNPVVDVPVLQPATGADEPTGEEAPPAGEETPPAVEEEQGQETPVTQPVDEGSLHAEPEAVSGQPEAVVPSPEVTENLQTAEGASEVSEPAAEAPVIPAPEVTAAAPVDPPQEVAAPSTVSGFAEGEVLLKFKENITREQKDEVLTNLGVSINGENQVLRFDLVKVAVGQEQSMIDALMEQGYLEWGQTNTTCQVDYAADEYQANIIPNDATDAMSKFNYNRLNAYPAWDVTTGNSNVTIAILDSGIQTTNLDFTGRLVEGYNGFDGSSNVEDLFGHGTHVAGIAAATGNDGYGIAGVDWQAKIMPVKVLNDTGLGSSTSIANGIIWAVDHGADVLNLSLGSSSVQQPIQDAIMYAHNHGVVVVASAGNDGDTRYNYPASYENVISVGSVSAANTVSSFSNKNDKVDVTAPGVNVPSDSLTGGITTKTGTSQAAPWVTGLASLLFGMEKFNQNPDAIEEAIENSATDLGDPGRDNSYGFGMINLLAAINYIFATPVPTFAAPTPIPPTAIPPTAVPPTAIPPTAVPPTAVPPTAIPPTAIPPTAQPTDTVPQPPVNPGRTPEPPVLPLDGAIVPAGTIGADAPELATAGPWQLIQLSGARQAPVLVSSTPGASLGLRFSGTRVSFLFPRVSRPRAGEHPH